jgi:ribosomal protein L11 methyltransferase
MKRGRRYRRSLDLGTGSGVLAIAAAKVFRAPAMATDIDPVATEVARANARINGVAPLVRTATGAGTRMALVREGAPYDLIFANILAKPLIRLAPEIAAVAAPGGRLILSGLLGHQVPPVRAAFEASGFSFSAYRRLDGWATLILRRSG